MFILIFFFFFSSRRRHTRSDRDWSSDVCSSDLLKVGGAALDEARIYRVAINDFLARGGDGYTTFRDARRIIPDADAPLLANVVMVYIREIGTVRTGIEGRMVLR